jgi:nucleotide-binding universal stress UspA family protein
MAHGVIVVGIDGSATSQRAGAYAVGLARRQGSQVIAVYVRPSAGGMLSLADPCGVAVAAAVEAQNNVEKEFRDAIRREKALIDVDLELLVRYGDPFTELSRAADELRADAVVVGRSQGALHRLTGSVAVRLVRAGRWPVIVVP